jgi:hypothetical protein
MKAYWFAIRGFLNANYTQDQVISNIFLLKNEK